MKLVGQLPSEARFHVKLHPPLPRAISSGTGDLLSSFGNIAPKLDIEALQERLLEFPRSDFGDFVSIRIGTAAIAIKRKLPRFVHIERGSVFTHIDGDSVDSPGEWPWGVEQGDERSVEELLKRFCERSKPRGLLGVAEGPLQEIEEWQLKYEAEQTLFSPTNRKIADSTVLSY